MNTDHTSNTQTDAERNAWAKVARICALTEAMRINFDELGRMRDDYAARTQFVTGSNVPGYLPESDPDEHTSFDEAKAGLIAVIQCDADDSLLDALNDVEGAEARMHELTRAIEAAKLESAPFCVIAAGRAYWVAAAEEQDESEFDDLREIEATLVEADLKGAADAEDVEDAIQELPLSIELRSGWHTIGEDLEAAEVRVVLTYGGPSCEIRADYDPQTGCSRPRVLWTEWGALGELTGFNRDAVTDFLNYLLPV